MDFAGFHVCPGCKPEAVRKLAIGEPIGKLWRNGRLLVAVRDVTFPGRCAICNAPVASGSFRTIKFFWLHPRWGLLLLATPVYGLGLFAFLVAVAFENREGVMRVALCSVHRSKPIKSILPGACTALIGTALACVSIAILGGHILDLDLVWVKVLAGSTGLAGLGLMAGGVLRSVDARRIFLAANIDRTHMFIKGAGEPFLAELPEWPGV